MTFGSSQGDLAQEAVLTKLDIDLVEPGSRWHGWVHLGEDARRAPWLAPVMVLRGLAPGPCVGITAAIHGNELNGTFAIHRLFEELDHTTLRGTVVGIPVVNVPGFLLEQREFLDGTDLNRIMPGKATGAAAALYAHRVVERLISPLDFLLDLHTASFGRVNSLYVRASLQDPIGARMAWLQSPSIVLDNAESGTLRAAATALGIPSITVEIGDPQRLQDAMVVEAVRGLRNILEDLDMVERDEWEPRPHIVCGSSAWLYTDQGGILHVLPDLCELVVKGQVIAEVRDLFGRTMAQYVAPHDGVIIGKSTNPVAYAGARIAHLGVVTELSHEVQSPPLAKLWKPRAAR